MSQKSQHTRSFVAKIIKYAHFCRENHNIRTLWSREKKKKFIKVGRGGGQRFMNFIHKIPFFFLLMASLRVGIFVHTTKEGKA